MQALRTAATGMAAQQLNVEVISNNIANMNTVAFKRQRAEFQDLLYQTLQAPGAQSSDQGTVVPTGVQIGAGVKAGSVYRIGTQGSLTQHPEQPTTWRSTGAAIFQVLMPSGETAYTRAGNLSINDQGQLVTQDGYLIQPAITVRQGRHDGGHHLGQSGQVQVSRARHRRPRQRGRQSRARHLHQRGRPLGPGQRTLFLESAASGAATTGTLGRQRGVGTLMQGYTEASNVDPVSEITALIVAQRAYEMNSKVISTADSMLGVANQVKS